MESEEAVSGILAEHGKLLSPGDRFGRFKIEELLGYSGMSVSYRAKEAGTANAVALKVLSPRFSAVPGLKEYLRGAVKRQFAALKHPKLARVLRAGVSANRIFIAREYSAGGSAKDKIVSGELFTEEQVRALVEEIVPAIHFLHRQGIIHQMLRPANILFDARGGVKVADFGLPLLLEAATAEAIETGVQYISIDYIAPEQISGKSVSPATDVYSLAAVIYTLFTGLAPFDADDPRSLLEQQLIKSAPSVGPLASPEFEAQLRRAMDFAPDRRPPTMEAFAAELGIAIDIDTEEDPTAKLTPVGGPPEAARKQHAPRRLPARGHAPKIHIGDKFARLTIRQRVAFTPITTVFRASDKSDVRQVALKILSPEFDELPDFANYFRSIVRRFTRIRHANLIPIMGGGHSHNYLYYSVPFLSGGTLADRLKSGPLDPDDAVAILKKIAPAISYLHQEGIVHQGIKPSNIHFDEEGNAHLAEVGLGPMLYAAASTFVAPGKLGPIGYRSPEQLAGRRKGSKLDTRSDIYSLGVMLFEMLTGRTPFEAETAADLALLQFSSPVPSPRQARPEELQRLDRQLDKVLRSALSYSPRGRFKSVSELMSAITGAIPLDIPDSDVIAMPVVAS